MSFDNLHPAVLVTGAIILLVNIGASWALIRDDGATLRQKIFQFTVIWLLPAVGGALILALIGSHHTRDEMKTMVPFPFYLAAVDPRGANPNRDDYGSADLPGDSGSVEGSCGSE